MKKAPLCLMVLFLGTISHAEKDLNQSMNQLEVGSSINCLSAIEPVLVKLTHPSSLSKYLPEAFNKKAVAIAEKTRVAVLNNLQVYEGWANEAIHNAQNGFSNAYVQKEVNASLDAHSTDTVLALPVGKAISACVRAHVNFSGTPQQQIATAQAVLKKSAKIRKAVN